MDKFNHFDYVPSTISKTKGRSTFKYKRKIATTANLGWLYPLGAPEDMMPDSTLEINDFRCEVRSQAMVAPLMDELYLDVFAFYTPKRVLWEHWEQFLGATDNVLYDNLSEYHVPYVNFQFASGAMSIAGLNIDYAWQQGLACHFELPRLVNDSNDIYRKISALPLRNYTFVWNEYFRPECVPPVLFSKTDRGNSGENVDITYATTSVIGGVTIALLKPGSILGSDPDTEVSYGAVLPAYRAHKSLWTSCLPKPSLETLNLLGAIGDLPVGFIPSSTGTTTGSQAIGLPSGASVTKDKFEQAVTSNNGGISGNNNLAIVASWKDVSLTVNSYRETIMLQNYYDCLNRAGSRYGEILSNLFDTVVNPKTIGIPLIITHKRFIIYRNQIEATADSATSNVGAQKGYIDTICRDYLFNYTADEHAYIQLFYCIRAADIRMADGIAPQWTKFDKFDLYYKQFDGLGDVARYKEEIAIDTTYDTNGVNPAIFGYQEYGAEEKYQRNSACAWLDPNAQAQITGYTLCEDVAFADVFLSTDMYSYLSCLPECDAFAKCLQNPSLYLAPQFIIDFRLNGKITKPMPVYNIPGNGALL